MTINIPDEAAARAHAYAALCELNRRKVRPSAPKADVGGEA